MPRKAKKFNRDAMFSEFYDSNYRYIRNLIASRFMGSIKKQDLEDACQETMIRIYSNLHTFRGRSTLKTWASRVALNYCKNFFRYNTIAKRDMRKTVYLDSNNSDSTLLKFAAFEVKKINKSIDRKNDSLNNILISDLVEKIKHIVSRLPKKYSDVFTEIYINERDHEETAKLLGINHLTVRSRINRARAKIKSLFNKKYKDVYL